MTVWTWTRAAVVVGGMTIGVLWALHATPWWPRVSLVVKHAPLCHLENIGLLPPMRARYSPTAGKTVDVLRCSPRRAPEHSGNEFGHDLIVVSDLGRSVQRFSRSGKLVWQRALDMPRGIDLQSDRLYVADGNELHILDPASGADLGSIMLDQPILALRIVGSDLFALRAIDAVGALAQYRLEDGAIRLLRHFPQRFEHGRGVDLKEGTLFVADTFGHRVVALNVDTQQLIREAPSYFPNSVQADGDGLLVAEEHLNEVSILSMASLERKVVQIGCRYARGLKDVDGLRQAANVAGSDGRSPCARRNSTGDDLYSPNDARQAGLFTYVADSDNHRIVAFRDGRLWGELNGFNSPVNVRVVAQ